MTFQDYDPGEGSVEELWERATGAAPRKKQKKRVWKATADFTPRPKGCVVDRSDPDYQKALAAARKGMPEFAAITFLEAVMFDNGEAGRARGTPRHQIKLGWTCAPPGAIAKADRSQHLAVRYLPLATREQARDNWNRQRRRQGQFRFEAEEREVIDFVLDAAKRHDAGRAEGQPAALMGCLSHRFGQEGTIRHAQVGYVQWRPHEGGWLPCLSILHTMKDEVLTTRDPVTGERRPGILMQPGRGEGVVAYGSHYGDEFVAHMRPAYADDLVRANLTRMAGRAAA